jgi:hypothetical protein
MSVAVVQALDLSYLGIAAGGVAQLARQRYSGLIVRDMGELDNTHYGATEVRQVLHGKGEAATTAASACYWESRLAHSRQIEASE